MTADLVIMVMAGGYKIIHFAAWEFYSTPWVFYCSSEEQQKYIPVVKEFVFSIRFSLH